MPPELQTIETLFKMADTKGAIDEFVRAFEAVMQVLLTVKADTDEERAKLRAQVATAIRNIEARAANLKDGRPGRDGAPGEKGEPGEPGHTPTVAELTRIIRPLIPAPLPGSPDSAEDIRNKLELLPDGEKLAMSAIEGLLDLIDEMNIRINKKSMLVPIAGGTGSSSGSGSTLSVETPTGDVDGSNTSFTVSNVPVFIIVDGIQRPLVSDINDIDGNGFTYAGGTITVHSSTPPVKFIRSYYNA